MGKKLHNALVESVVACGMNEHTGLRLVHPVSSKIKKSSGTTLFGIDYDPKVLAEINHNSAIFPPNPIDKDWRYPPAEIDPSLHGFQAKGLLDSALPSKAGSGGFQQWKNRMERRNTAFHHRRQSLCMRKTSLKNSETVLFSEELKAMTLLCFPDGAYVNHSPHKEKIHHFVLTDMTGNRTFATCLTLYRKYIASKTDSSCEMLYSLQHPEFGASLADDQYTCYVPTCVIIISKHCYFTVFKDCLSGLASRIGINPKDFDGYLKDLAIRLTLTPIPPAGGKISLSFEIFGQPLKLIPSEFPEQPVVDFPLACVFLRLTTSDILRVLGALLLQQRTLFMSSNYALLTLAQEAFMHFLYPFKWRFTYVPILAKDMLEIVEAPGTWIMGCHSIHRNQIQQVEGIVVVDLDCGTVNICDTIYCPAIPQHWADAFLSTMKTTKMHFELDNIGRLSPLTMEELVASREKHQLKFHRHLKHAFLELMVNLFGDVAINYIIIEKAKFKHKAFLNSRTDEERPFYVEAVKTDLFNQFVKDRVAQKRDLFSMMQERTRSASHRQSRKSTLLRKNTATGRTGSLPIRDEAENIVINLPRYEFEGGRHFLDRAIDELTVSIQSSKSAGVRASSLYLRGMIYIAKEMVMKGFHDFCSLFSNDDRLFPYEAVNSVISNMTISSREALMSHPVYDKLKQQFGITVSTSSNDGADFTLEQDVTPEYDVGFEEFAELVSSVGIVSDYDMLHRLFLALTVGRRPSLQVGHSVVDPETFALFVDCWKENEVQCQSLKIYEDKLDDESILKSSYLVKSDNGTGRFILSDKCLYFLQDGDDEMKKITRIKDILSLEKYKESSLFSSADALIVHCINGRSFSVCLKEERNEWAMLIEEMWFGVCSARSLRDAGIIQQAAQNVVLLDAVIRSGNEEAASHHNSVEMAAKVVAHFTNQQELGVATLSKETKEMLLQKINPNVREREKSTVEALLYTPGRENFKTDDSSRPKLWVGMGNGKVKVYDAMTWMLESECLQAGKKVVCLLAVGDNHVWAGSFDRFIYIIDVRTCTSNQRLLEHDDMMAHMVLSEDKSKVFTASLNGQIITWNAESLTKIGYPIQLNEISGLRSLAVLDGNLWCGVREEILIVSKTGEVLQRVKYFDEATKKQVQINCFLLTPNRQVWTGSDRNYDIAVWDVDDLTKPLKIHKVECRGFNRIVLAKDKIWAGSKNGLIYIFNSENLTLEKQGLSAHSREAIRSMCTADDRYVISGSDTSEGKIAIWGTAPVVLHNLLSQKGFDFDVIYEEEEFY